MPNTNPSPKLRFLNDKVAVHAHREIMQSPSLQHSVDMALLEYQGILQLRTPPEAPAVGHLKMVGALEFLSVLKNLGEATAPVPVVVDRDNLQHKT